MKKVIHIYKTYKPFTHGGVETYIDSIINYKNSKFKHTLLSIGNINHTNQKKKYLKKVFQLILIPYLFNFFFIYIKM